MIGELEKIRLSEGHSSNFLDDDKRGTELT